MIPGKLYKTFIGHVSFDKGKHVPNKSLFILLVIEDVMDIYCDIKITVLYKTQTLVRDMRKEQFFLWFKEVE